MADLAALHERGEGCGDRRPEQARKSPQPRCLPGSTPPCRCSSCQSSIRLPLHQYASWVTFLI